jgi:mRNA interferase RelE/StbE
MTYLLIIPRSVRKEIDKLPKKIADKILQEITALQKDPRPPNCKKLAGREAWRIRVGDHRIIYEIDNKAKTVTLYRIRHRGSAYR